MLIEHKYSYHFLLHKNMYKDQQFLSLLLQDSSDLLALDGCLRHHVWITSNTILTKGVYVADGCIIAQGAVVTKSIEERNCLIGGVPAKIISKNIEWRK